MEIIIQHLFATPSVRVLNNYIHHMPYIWLWKGMEARVEGRPEGMEHFWMENGKYRYRN